LGFGHGTNIVTQAVATTTRWSGTDFIPSQAAFAQDLVRPSGAEAGLYDQSFAEFCRRDDLPDFDFISLHGIWSWVSDDNRHIIVDFIRRKLKVGGVLYISYNSSCGWAPMMPVRELMAEHNQLLGAPGSDLLGRVDQALAFVDTLMAANPLYAAVNPQIKLRLEKLREQDRRYIAHEYFNQSWTPMSFTQVQRWLEPAKLNFACSADYLNNIAAITLTAPQQEALRQIAEPGLRQNALDFLLNQTFRKDYWVRGPRQLSAEAANTLKRAQRFVLGTPKHAVRRQLKTGVGEIRLPDAIYTPVIEAMADHVPATLDTIAARCPGLPFDAVFQAVYVLCGLSQVFAAQGSDLVVAVQQRTAALNRHIVAMTKDGSELNYLASPVTGGPVHVSRLHQQFLAALWNGATEPRAWVEAAAANAVSQGLLEQAEAFAASELPVLRGLGIASNNLN